MPLSAGTRLGPYEILGPIGAGGMGEVYKARDPRLDRTVAIKILPSADPDLKVRFEREAKAIAALQHPHICTLFDVGSQDGTDYLVMEYLEGRTLRKVLSERILPAKRTIRYAIQLCQGLAAAHDQGIVHRDLKPENVFVTNAELIKILDFGLAQVREKSRVSPNTTTLDTRPGVVLGTVGYMSPEQIKGEPVDSRSDVFSLGVILYEMVTGRQPFRGANYVETMHAILKANPSPLRNSGDQVLTMLNRIIERCLEKDRDRRFQSAREIFTVRGAQLIVATPIPEGGNQATSGLTEPPGTSVTYGDPPNWLLWLGPMVFALVVVGFFTIVVFLPTRISLIRGCISSSDGRTFILLVPEPSSYHGEYKLFGPNGHDLESIKGYDVLTEVGYQVEVSYLEMSQSPGTGSLNIREVKRLADTCSEVKP